MTSTGIEVWPLTLERWADLEQLFAEPGDAGRCWCMWWYLKRSEFSGLGRDGRKSRFRSLVEAGQVPGLLAYVDGQPAGWCAIGPRESFGRLERSPVLRRVDDECVWSIVCFFVGHRYRRQGLMSALLQGAISFAADQGVHVLEGYPMAFDGECRRDGDAYTGVASVFTAFGFEEVARPSAARRIMRFRISAPSRT